MGKDKEEIEPEQEKISAQIEVIIDSEEKAELLEEFFTTYKHVSNEELRKRLQLDDDEEERAAPFE